MEYYNYDDYLQEEESLFFKMFCTVMDQVLIHEVKNSVSNTILLLTSLLVYGLLQYITTWPLLDNIAIFIIIGIGILSLWKDIGMVLSISVPAELLANGNVNLPHGIQFLRIPALFIFAFRAFGHCSVVYITSFLFDQTCSYDGKKPSTFFWEHFFGADNEDNKAIYDISGFRDIDCPFGIFGIVMAIMVGSVFIVSAVRIVVISIECIYDIICRLT